MAARESKLNRFLLGYLDMVTADIPTERLAERAPGGGHPPIWVLGHLAICAEMGQQALGGVMVHPDWVAKFGPGSSDDITDADGCTKDELVAMIKQGYVQLGEMFAAADEEHLAKPHGLAILDGTPIETIADIVAHLLTTHFSFHLAQLSGWRRGAGLGPLI